MVSRAGYLNVGPIINPVDALSGSLQDLSKMYAAQSNKKQAREAAAKEQLYKDNVRGARRDTNEFLTGVGKGRLPKFELSDHSEKMQKTFADRSASFDREELAMRNYLKHGSEKDLNASLSFIKRAKGEDKLVSDEAKAQRKANLLAVRFNLESLSGDARIAAIDGQMNSVFGEKRAALDRSIASGSTMVKRQLATAIMRHQPESSKEYGDFASIRQAVLGSLHGNTEQRLLASNAAETKAFNAASKSKYDQQMTTYRAKLKSYKNSTDYKGLTALFGEDIGSVDNKRRENIVDYLLEQNMPHAGIVMVVKRLTEDNFMGLSKSIPKLNDKETQTLIHDQLTTMRAKGELTGIADIKKPKAWTAVQAKDLDAIQKGLLSSEYTTSRGVLDVSQKWRDNYARSLPGVPASNVPAGTNGVPSGIARPASVNRPTPASVASNYNKTMTTAASLGDYTKTMAHAESGGNPKAVSPGVDGKSGHYLGLYQMGDKALEDAGYKDVDGKWLGVNGVNSRADFLNNVEAQNDAFSVYSKKNEGYIKSKGLLKHVGTTFQGVEVTLEGLKAASHLVGASAVAKMFETGKVPADANGTKALSYLHMGGMSSKGVSAGPVTERLPASNMVTQKVNGVDVLLDPDVPIDFDTDIEKARQAARTAYTTSTAPEKAYGAAEMVGAAVGAIPGAAGYVLGGATDLYDRIAGNEYRNKAAEFARNASFFQIDEDSSNVAKRLNKWFNEDVAPYIPANLSAMQVTSMLNYGKAYRAALKPVTRKGRASYSRAASELADEAQQRKREANVSKYDVGTKRDKEIAALQKKYGSEGPPGLKTKAESEKVTSQEKKMFDDNEFVTTYDKRYGDGAFNAAYDKHLPRWNEWKGIKGF